MEPIVPKVIQPLLTAYLHGLEPLQSHFYGIYITDSIALGAFEEQASDIDVIALTQGEWSTSELKQLKTLHTHLLKADPLGKRLEVCYIPLRYLGTMRTGKPGDVVDPFPVMHDGVFVPASSGGLNAVTWWIIQHHGFCLLGPQRSELPLEVTWQDVLATMRFNLDVYFARQARRSYIYWSDVAVEFGVTTLCRILTTIEDGEMLAKSASLQRLHERLPPRWRPLLAEAWRLRHRLRQPSLYPQRFTRMCETLAFIQYVRERGHQGLESAAQASEMPS